YDRHGNRVNLFNVNPIKRYTNKVIELSIRDTFGYKRGDSDNIVRTDTHNNCSLEWHTDYDYKK
ncbi:hypothetical protein, partial [Psychrobacter sp. DAB_AL32B]|uniref:hypothetical protein n=1 Tax=Psychrobacter sp. DAB_AL32B TaxID=1028414 RepID=UPI000B9D134A